MPMNVRNPSLPRFIAAQLSPFEVFARANHARAAATFLKELKKNLSQKGSGRFYRSTRTVWSKGSSRSGGMIGRVRSKMHQASAPGEPPAPDTRRLKKSARISKRETHPWGARIRIEVGGKKAPYAVPLEFGSRSRGLAPRPYMRPTVIIAAPRMTLAMAQSGAGIRIVAGTAALTKTPGFSTLLGGKG